MIIHANNSPASSLVNNTPTRPQKAKASSPTDTADAAFADRVLITSQNMASTVSPLQDADATRSALQAVRQQFISQPIIALRAQANQLPQNALQLLQ